MRKYQQGILMESQCIDSVCMNCCCCHLKGQFIWGLGDVALDDMGSSNSWHIDGRLFMDQQVISLIVDLVHTHKNFGEVVM